MQECNKKKEEKCTYNSSRMIESQNDRNGERWNDNM